MHPPTPRNSDHPRYRALLWDNDGVLVDTERWYFQANREVLGEVGVELTPELYLEHFLKSSNGAWHLAAHLGFTEEQVEALRCERNARYMRHLEVQPLPIDGVAEVLAALRPHFNMGIVTSSRREHFDVIHQRTGFLRYFDFVITSDDCGATKPSPEPYLRAIERTGFSANDCLAIEDAPRGLTAARAAGLDCWVVPSHFSQALDFPGATRLLPSLAAAAELLLGHVNL